jgi:hypothetical protein
MLGIEWVHVASSSTAQARFFFIDLSKQTTKWHPFRNGVEMIAMRAYESVSIAQDPHHPGSYRLLANPRVEFSMDLKCWNTLQTCFFELAHQ